MTYDSAAWTGRSPRRRFPLFGMTLQTPWLAVRVGTLAHHDAYGCDIAWGRVRNPGRFDLAYVHYRTWAWWTAEQVYLR